MRIKDIVKILTDSGIEENEANIEVKLMLEYCANYTLADIITGEKLSDEKLKIVEEKAKLRANTRKPIQYIIGLADFMGEKFIVNQSVLIPRDETEFLVRQAIKIIKQEKYTNVMDMCTGTGCIACIIAKHTQASVLGVDISTEALHLAIKNMENLGLYNRATFRKSNLFEKIRKDEKFDIIVSNPPYIAPKYRQNIQPEVTYEPDIALYTNDEEGLEFYKKISSEAPNYLKKGGYLMFELGYGQSNDVSQILHDNGYKSIKVIKDLAKIDRVIYAHV